MIGPQGGSGPGWYYRGKHYTAPQLLHEAMNAEIDRLELQYNELVMLVVPQHLWISTGARVSDHEDCETCAWLEKNTKFGEKAKTEKRNHEGDGK